MIKNIFVLSGPFRAGKSFLCNLLQKQGIKQYDMDVFTKKLTLKKTYEVADEIATNISKVVTRDMKSQDNLLFCGASVYYCIDEKCPVDLIQLVEQTVKIMDPTNIYVFHKFYLDVDPKQLFENIVTSRSKNRETSPREIARQEFLQQLGTPEYKESSFLHWYDKLMKMQVLATFFSKNRDVHQKFGYQIITSEQFQKWIALTLNKELEQTKK